MCCNEKGVQGLKLIEDKFYKKPWFWIGMVIMVYCITRPYVIVMCGNGSGNNYNGNDKKE